MAILNYTTKVKADKTAGEILQILGKCGAKAVMSEYENSEVTAIAFQFELNKQILSFRLPINHEGVLQAMLSNCPNHFCYEAQAKRVAWRIVKDWVEAQLALVEANQADTVEVFLPYLQDRDGLTLYKKLVTNGFKALGVDG